MKVLVNGGGNIGTTLVNLLLFYKNEIGLDEIYWCKRTINAWNQQELSLLEEKGVRLCSIDNPDYPRFKEVMREVDYIFEATANGVGLKNWERYQQLSNLKGASAQGSEKGFGIPFMSGINEEKIQGQKFVNVVSCNTHGSAAILSTFCGNRLEHLAEADFVVVRRSEDLGNHQRLVSGNVVARHLDATIGTHHGIDVIDMFKTIGVDCNLTSSDITTPSQLTHSVRFNIQFKNGTPKNIDALIANNPFMATTNKFDSNVVFELGRRYGFQGRLYSHAILVKSNFLVTENSIKGWAFVPQEGNSILSTINAFLLQTSHPNSVDIMQHLKADLLREEW
jgi:glyceraldehyde-3-phosphate dehydrogenase (NAD(P))